MSDLPQAARAFADGDLDLLPSALGAAEVDALVALLVERADGARLERLASSPDKSLAKPARRGLHLLRTRGVALPKAEPRRFRVEKGPYESADLPSVATAIDGRGEQMVFLVGHAPDGNGLHVFQARLSEERGLVDFIAGAMSRKDWREHERGLLAEAGLGAARVPRVHARWLIERAYDRCVADGRSVPHGFAEARLELGPVERPERHPALDVAPPLPRDEARPRMASLHAIDALSAWVPNEDQLKALDLEIGQIMTSRLVVDPVGRHEQMGRAVERVAERALTPEFRARLAERLYESAYLLALRDRLDEARLCTACAELTRDESVPGSENPFVLALFDRLVDRDRLLGAQP